MHLTCECHVHACYMGTVVCAPVRHSIEFLMGDKVLPYNLTIFQAIKQHGLVSQDSRSSARIKCGMTIAWCVCACVCVCVCVRAHVLCV